MAFAAWTKGTSALLLATRAVARAEEVEVFHPGRLQRGSPSRDSHERLDVRLQAAGPRSVPLEPRRRPSWSPYSSVSPGTPRGAHRGRIYIRAGGQSGPQA
jgi:hypothetical protein